jgi:cell wall-associated NlpC family hydrolase
MASFTTGCGQTLATYTVNKPLVDLRAVPFTYPQSWNQDPQQETQLLFGETVHVLAQRSGWAQVEAVEQPEYSHAQRWTGYPGWVPLEALNPAPAPPPTVVVTSPWALLQSEDGQYRELPMGTRLQAKEEKAAAPHAWTIYLGAQRFFLPRAYATALAGLAGLPRSALRQHIITQAEKLIGTPYLWGGRTPHKSSTTTLITGVDCSGLVNLAYRSSGVDIPRDAHEQFLRARPIPSPQPADLVFLSAAGDPHRMVHVMLYAGNGEVIEGPGTGHVVRRIALRQRLHWSTESLEPGLQVPSGQTVWFGTYFE